MQKIFNSLSFRIGGIIVLVELITLTIAGIIYLNNFSAQVDGRLEAAVSIPDKLMNAGLLDFSAVNDAETMREVVGEDVRTALVVATNNIVFFSSNPDYIGQDIHDLAAIEVATFDESAKTTAPVLRQQGEILAHVAPIYGPDGRTPRFFAYIEVGNAEAIAQKNAIAQIFILGTIGTVAVTSLVIFFSFNITVLRRVLDVMNTLKRVENGDLSARVPVANAMAKDEIGALQNSVNSMVSRLQNLVNNLEERVTERTRDLTIASNVSRQVTTILDLDDLLPQVVAQTREGFGFYHASIFLYDEDAGSLKLRASIGRDGVMMQPGSQVFHLRDQGLVAKAARNRQPVLVNDVALAADYFRNPRLPETQSELSVPMLIGTKLIGVLDLQSEKLDRFSDNEQRVLQSLAEQVAVAVENARLYGEQLRVAEELRALDDMKSQFLASMSHELRTPLNAILNFTKFISMNVYGPVTDKQKDALDKIVNSAQHLLSLINDVLDITKIESGMMQLFIEDDVNPNEELESVVATAETLLANKPVRFIQDIDDNLPIIVGDKRRIRQILLNLVSNACKFTDEGSVTLSAKNRGQELLFAVIDTGPGIAAEDLEIIFEPFQQTEHGIKHAGGTGLGLPISKKLAEAHGGRLWLETTRGEGSAFYVTLPVRSPELLKMLDFSEETA